MSADDHERRPVAYPQPYLLTDAEHRAITMAGELWNLLAREVVGADKTRDADLAELIGHVHAIQRYVGSQAAARAYPDRFRALGEMLQP